MLSALVGHASAGHAGVVSRDMVKSWALAAAAETIDRTAGAYTGACRARERDTDELAFLIRCRAPETVGARDWWWLAYAEGGERVALVPLNGRAARAAPRRGDRYPGLPGWQDVRRADVAPTDRRAARAAARRAFGVD